MSNIESSMYNYFYFRLIVTNITLSVWKFPREKKNLPKNTGFFSALSKPPLTNVRLYAIIRVFPANKNVPPVAHTFRISSVDSLVRISLLLRVLSLLFLLLLLPLFPAAFLEN